MMVETLSGSWEKRSSPLLTLRTPNLPGTQRVGSPSRKQKKRPRRMGILVMWEGSMGRGFEQTQEIETQPGPSRFGAQEVLAGTAEAGTRLGCEVRTAWKAGHGEGAQLSRKREKRRQ